MRIAIDFDETIIKKTHYPCIKYELMDGAKEAISKLSKNHTLILNTARYGWYRLPAIWCIKKNKLPIKTTLLNKKPQADIYIDNNNLYCNGIDWEQIERDIDGKKAREQ